MNNYLVILAALLFLLVCVGVVYLIVKQIRARWITYPGTGEIVVGDTSQVKVGTKLTIGGVERVRVVKVDGATLTVEYIEP